MEYPTRIDANGKPHYFNVERACKAMTMAHNTMLKACGWRVDITPDTMSADCCVYDSNGYIMTSGKSVDEMWSYLGGASVMFYRYEKLLDDIKHRKVNHFEDVEI